MTREPSCAIVGDHFCEWKPQRQCEGKSVSSRGLFVRLGDRGPVVFGVGFVVLLLVLVGQLAYVANATSSTWDEPHHLFDGYTVWKTGDYGLNPEVPPLVKLAAALPLLRMHLKIPVAQGRSIPN